MQSPRLKYLQSLTSRVIQYANRRGMGEKKVRYLKSALC